MSFINNNVYRFSFQFSDFLQSYNKLSELCFVDCVNDFTSRTLKSSEVSVMSIDAKSMRVNCCKSCFHRTGVVFQDSCALNCMEKYLKMNQRISQRFQEFQLLANENAVAMAQKAGQS